MYQQLRFVAFLIFALVSCEAFAASDPYGNCIKSYEFGGTPTENIALAPINPSCQKMCANECGSFSRKSSSGMEINAQAITNCLPVCQSGNLYSSYIYEEVRTGDQDKPYKQVVRGPYSTSVACTGVLNASKNVYKSDMKIVPGDKIKLTLVNAENANKIYLCGKKSVMLDPLVSSLNPGDWESLKTPQTVLNDRTDKVCAVSMNDKNWQASSNKSLWYNLDQWPRKDLNKPGDATDICLWSARNAYFTDTGIWAKDGDELTISWESSYLYNTQGLPTNVPLTRFNINKLLSDSNFKGNKAAVRSILDNQGSMQVLRPGGKPSDFKAAYVELRGEGARIFKPGEQLDPAKLLPENRPASASWFGLNGIVQDLDYKVTPITTGSDCDTEEKRLTNYQKCARLDDPGIPLYSFRGILGSSGDSFSKTPAPIALKHWQPTAWRPGLYDHAAGGIKVTIEWGGCPFVEGQMLQYAISTGDLVRNPDFVPWHDVPIGVFQNGDTIPVTSSGNFYLRIKPLEVPADIPEELKIYYTDPAHRFGQYYINLAKLNESTFLQDDGVIKQIVNSVRYTLYGDPKDSSKKGVVRKLYEALVEETPVIAGVRALLVLFIALTGFGYLVGTLQMNQRDMVIRIAKLAFVATLISPGSWDFFANHFFKLFIDGGLELIGKIITGSLGDKASLVNITADPASVFSIFDGPFKMLTSPQTWKKVYALILTGTLGLVVAVFIAVSVVFYILSVAKVILMFLMSMVIIALLIFVAPLFLCFMLFSATRQFFDSWWRFLISFTLQPVALFTSIAIFNLLIVTTIFGALGFTACPSCLFAIYIPAIVDFCLIPAWRVLAFSHFPDQLPGFFMPIGVLEASVLMLILTQGMFRFCEFISKVTNIIVSGQMINATSLADYGMKGLEAVKTVFGQDRVSLQRQSFQRQQDYQKAQQKAQANAEKRKKEEEEKRSR